jgi:hypothetical protein
MIVLTAQETEFAAACIEFVSQRDSELAKTFALAGHSFTYPENQISKAKFLKFGLRRLMKVMSLAVENDAVLPEHVPELTSSLQAFQKKLVAAFAILN